MIVIAKEMFKTMPWKNGLGISHEIYKDAKLRVSIASIDQDSQFFEKNLIFKIV